MGAGWAISKAIHACTVKTAEKTTEQGEPLSSKWGKRSLLSRASFDIKNICIITIDSRLRSEALFKFEGYSRCTDNHFISELVANGNIIGNSQTAKQMKDLRFKYEITL